MPFKKLWFGIFFLFLAKFIFAQPIAIGSWNSYLSYNTNKCLTHAGNIIYVGGTSGLFSLNTSTSEVQRLNTIQGLSELNVAVVKYDSESKALFVGYESTNIDILYQNGTSLEHIDDFTKFKVSDVFRYNVVGTKTIHDVYFYQKMAYICTSFGIVVYDIQKREVRDSYLNIGTGGVVPDVLGIAIANNKIYASTNLGVMEANLNAPNLSNYIFWNIVTDTIKKETTRNITTFNNKIYAVIDSVFKVYSGNGIWLPYSGINKHTLFGYDIFDNSLLTMHENGFLIEDVNGKKDSLAESFPVMAILLNGFIWFIKDDYGLIGKPVSGIGDLKFILPAGPKFNDAFSLDYNNNKMWVMAGKYSPRLEPSYSNAKFYSIENYNVKYYSSVNLNAFDTVRDCAVSASSKDGTHTYIGTFGSGLLEFINGDLTNVLGTGPPANFMYRKGANVDGVKITGLAYDNKNQLWAVNFLSSSTPLYCRLIDGTWRSFSINGLLGTRDVTGKVVIDNYGTKWIRTYEGNGLLAFNENDINDPSDDEVRLLNDQKGQGALASKDVQCLAVDQDGEVWIGTGNGVSVIGSPRRVFDLDAPDARTPYVREGSIGIPLLQYENVTAIEVDGANRKWIGTRNGLWLFNADGSKALKYFNIENSPLFSNNIIDLEIHQTTGELYIATDKGLIVYKTDAVAGGEEFGDVYAYPNPVRPGYTGTIAIKGLIADCIVKITDVAGNLVYETTSNGGEATWDGNDFSGHRASSGIYLVFASNKDGTKHYQTKIAFVN